MSTHTHVGSRTGGDTFRSFQVPSEVAQRYLHLPITVVHDTILDGTGLHLRSTANADGEFRFTLGRGPAPLPSPGASDVIELSRDEYAYLDRLPGKSRPIEVRDTSAGQLEQGAGPDASGYLMHVGFDRVEDARAFCPPPDWGPEVSAASFAA